MLGFETLTLVPIDLRLVEPKLLDASERDWLNAYHARVRREIGPFLDDAERRWLDKACRPVCTRSSADQLAQHHHADHPDDHRDDERQAQRRQWR